MVRSRYQHYSRLNRKEGQRYARQTFIFSILTILLIAALVFWGIPSLVKLAIFLGDLRSSAQPVVGEDTVPPAIPILQPTDEATNSATIRISGFAEDGTTIVLSNNGSDANEVLVENNGEFLFDAVRLHEGENAITVRAVDKAGNTSRSSSPLTINYDNIPPTLTVESPVDKARFLGTAEKIVRITGKTESGSIVRVNGALAILSSEGTFASSYSLVSGENTLTIVASDRAGNETLVTRTVFYEE